MDILSGNAVVQQRLSLVLYMLQKWGLLYSWMKIAYTLEDAQIERFYSIKRADTSWEIISKEIFEISEANRNI